ncbi:MAG TPA: flagellar assembly protein T N-terminal domain-containing protein, partial [Cytophagales bacterium]|nr:flagellar assembly protein T N-terminal domain-containing protein [Cytophagales bacterium]
MKRIFILLHVILGICVSQAQEVRSVEAKGLGVNRNDALQDALRNAVSQAVGVALSSQTSVENFMVISDAIATNTQGYIKSYSITSEKKNNENYEVNVKAEVTTTPLK